MAIRRLKRAVKSPIQPVPREQPLPASFYQEFAYLLQGDPVSNVLNMPQGAILGGQVNLRALEGTFAEMIRRHESLRCHFEPQESGPLLQKLEDRSRYHLPVIDISDLPPEVREQERQRLSAAFAGFPMNLHTGPLFITAAILLGQDAAGPSGGPGPNKVLVLMNLHHAFGDGWSMTVLNQELVTIYRALSKGRPSPLAPPRLQFADYAAWLRRRMDEGKLDPHRKFWHENLGGERAWPSLPYDRPRTDDIGSKVHGASLQFNPDTANDIRTFSRKLGCTVPITLLAGVHALLNGYSGQEDVTVAWVTAARNRPELAGMIGLFMNTVAVRADVGSDPSFEDLAVRVRKASLAAYDHQEMPYVTLLQELFPDRKLARTLLTPVVFNMLSFAPPPGSVGAATPMDLDVTMEMVGLGAEEQAKFDLTFTCMESPSVIALNLSAAAALFDKATVEAIRDDYQGLMSRAIANPALPMSELTSGLRLRSPSKQ